MSVPRRVHAVLFDLDGTLVDTAPDLIGALNTLRVQEGAEALPYPLARTQASHGSTGLIQLAFPDAGPERFEALRARFLDLYAARVAQDSRLFAGCEQMLGRLEAESIRWGIVTNKPGWLTAPLLVALQLDARAGCVISGDTLPQRKPHPAPLLHAAAALHVAPGDCVYVGDAERDILAARAAGMPVLVADYGYLGPDDDTPGWCADGALDSPLQILAWLGIDLQ